MALRRGQEHGLDFRIQPPVGRRQLKLELEVRHGPQAADNHTCMIRPNTIYQQPLETDDRDVVDVAGDFSYQLDAFLEREQWSFAGILGNCHNQIAKNMPGAEYQVQVPIGNRIEGPGIQCDQVEFAFSCAGKGP